MNYQVKTYQKVTGSAKSISSTGHANARLCAMAKTKIFAARKKQDEREKISDEKYVADANKNKQQID